jgi:hypothetical protein
MTAVFASLKLPRSAIERIMDTTPRPVPAEPLEIMIDRALRWKIMRQQCLLAARLQQIENCVHHRAKRRLASAAQSRLPWHEGLDQAPLTISQIACVAHAASVMVTSGEGCPSHLISPYLSQNTKNLIAALHSTPRTPAILEQTLRGGVTIG